MKRRIVCISIVAIAFLGACGPAVLKTSDFQPVPSPVPGWNLSLTQSGGFAGASLQVDVSSDGRLTAEDRRSGRTVTQTLSPEMLAKVTALSSQLPATGSQRPRSACADCFVYDLSYSLSESSGGRAVLIVHADDTTLDASGAGELIRLLRQLRDAALKSQP